MRMQVPVALATVALTPLCIIACMTAEKGSIQDHAERKTRGDHAWTLVFEENFSDASHMKNWLLDGFADLSMEGEGQIRYLRIGTKPSADNPNNFQSVLWRQERYRGDLRFEFRAKGEPGNCSIFYFNANPTKGSGYDSIFDWERPDAQMARYAGSEKIEMYSVGILRDVGKCNFRCIGGNTVDAYRKPDRRETRIHEKATLICSYDSPFEQKPDTWFTFDLQIVGRRITLKVDGEQVFEVEDNGKDEPGVFSRTPLTNGGFFGFRNFKPNAVCVDYIKVYSR